MGSMEPPLLKGCLRKYYVQTYTTLTLELRTSTVTITVITRMYQLQYQEFNAHLAYTCTYILCAGNHRDNEQSEQAN